MSTYVIYATMRTENVPVGLALGDIFLSQTMGTLNPLGNSIQLRVLRDEDKTHQHVTDMNTKNSYFTLKVNGRFDVGSLMGFSGTQCYHFSMKTWLLLHVRPRIIANGNERCLHDNQHNLLVQGDVRLVLDRSNCNIYLLRGCIFDNGQFCAQNNEHSLTLDMVQINSTLDCNWINMPTSSTKENFPIVVKQSSSSDTENDTNSNTSDLLYVGFLKRFDNIRHDAIALITGVVYRAQVEPYRFGKSKFDFELLYMANENSQLQETIEKSFSLITIIPKNEARTSIYSTSGHGFTVCQNSTVKICGQLLIVDNKDGSLISRLNGIQTITHLFGHLKIYVCDENIILLDNKTRCFSLESQQYETSSK